MFNNSYERKTINNNTFYNFFTEFVNVFLSSENNNVN